MRYLRLQTQPHRLTDRPDVLLDKSIHAARCRDMAPNDGRVTLRPFDTAEHALDVVDDRYTRLAATDPALSKNITPAAPEDLRYWHARQQLWAITCGAQTIGVFAVAPGTIGWITGQEINEEVIGAAHTGQRYATSAQCAWAHCWAADTTDLLVGTIDRHNHASRASALRAGRPRVLDNVFIALAN
ncbi:N-acetyltransferase [Mycolicibacterium sp. P9-22]|nr:N-acetyltransferase [Mycolicibacterium sp. P9-22]